MKVSIITTTFNSGKTVRSTIESVKRQTYKEIEHIIIDGGSTDNTIAIVKEYDNESAYKVISEPDKGLYDAINKGIRLASGNIIGILNSDDFFASDTIIETVVDQLSNSTLDAVYGDVDYITQEEPFEMVRHYSSRLFRPSLMRFGFMPAHPSFYIKKEKLAEIGFYNDSYKIASDFEFLLRCFITHNIKSCYIDKTFVYMRIGGISNKNLNSRKTIFTEHKKALKDNGIYSNSFLLCLRYPIKIIELVVFKIKKLLGLTVKKIENPVEK